MVIVEQMAIVLMKKLLYLTNFVLVFLKLGNVILNT